MYIRDRREREEYMDSLEQQMEHQRQQIRHTLDRMEGSGRRRTALEGLRSSLASFRGHTSIKDAEEERETATEMPMSHPPGASEGVREGAQRPWWRRVFGG